MNLNYKNEKGITVIEFCGELDNHTANLTKKDLDMIMEKSQSTNYIFDLSKLKFMDSSGIGILLGRYRTIKNNGGNLFVRNLNPQIDKVFRVSGLYQVLIKMDKN
jgi:stage II sporulation protein AA (anti-sigma F factor antagonist)